MDIICIQNMLDYYAQALRYGAVLWLGSKNAIIETPYGVSLYYVNDTLANAHELDSAKDLQELIYWGDLDLTPWKLVPPYKHLSKQSDCVQLELF